jgi:hypothetical protein
MRKRTSIDREAALFAGRASQQLRQLQSAMRSSEDNLTGLHRILKVPVPTGSRYIKGSRTPASLLAQIGGASVSALLTGSFYISQTQTSSLLSKALT